MDRKQFILMAFASTRPAPDSFGKELAYLHTKADFLEQEGILDPPKAKGEKKPRKSVDYLARLEDWQRALFLQFWRYYNAVPKEYRSGGRNEAAMRWGDILPDEVLGRRIMEAARADAKRWTEAPTQGATRKFAQGWLSERRWEDYEPPPAQAPNGAPDDAEHRKALADLKHWEGLARLKPLDRNLEQQVEAARAKVRELQSSPLPQGEG
jgi:hypothetical protein